MSTKEESKTSVIFKKSSQSEKNVLWFNEIGIHDIPLVGGKNASLGEMYNNLTKKGISVPNGFAVTAHAYWQFMEHAKIRDKIKKAVKDFSEAKATLYAKPEVSRYFQLEKSFQDDINAYLGLSAYCEPRICAWNTDIFQAENDSGFQFFFRELLINGL